MVGDSQIGKTSLMVKYAGASLSPPRTAPFVPPHTCLECGVLFAEGHFDEDYIQTLGTPAAIMCDAICALPH